MFFLPSQGSEKPNSFNVIPDEGMEGYIWQKKMICAIAADSNDNFKKLYEQTDFAEVYELYILKRAKEI